MGASKTGRVGVLVTWALSGGAILSGCATGGDPENTSQAYEGPADPTDDEGTTGSATGPGSFTTNPFDDGDETPATTDQPMPPDLGMCSDDLDCVLPAGSCLEVLGECVDGFCQHGAAAPGASCDDGDPCTSSDACDGEGVCYGVAVDCGTGECVDGECTGGDCEEGMADCNGNAADGCEVQLGTDSDCTGCGDACSGPANATASCSAGACQFQCQAPYDNCDGDWGNGCEVPVGVEHSCSQSGIDAAGCWTAYCGASGDTSATNFGTYYCVDCPTCHVPSAGQCQWCNHTTGTFYPQDACACGTYEDLAC
jgi:hypothetical protein